MKNVFLIIALILIGTIKACKSEVAQWRGIDRNGIFEETNLMDQWPEEGPALLWVFEGLGRGYAAPSVSKEMIFVNGEQDGNTYLFAIDKEGKLLWKSPNGKEFLGEGFSSTYPGARSTPTLYGKLVYATSGMGNLTCYDARTGLEKWSMDIMEDLKGDLGYFGYSESVAVDEDKVYCFPGGETNNIVALNRFSGEKVWGSEVLRDTFAYGSPILVDLPTTKILITTSWHYIYAIDRSNGELLSSYKFEGRIVDGEHCNSPIYKDGSIYFVANDAKGQGTFKVKLSEDGTSLKELWRNPEVRNNFSGFVVLDDHLFTTIRGNKLLSLDTETGQIVDSLKVATGSISYADNKFFCYGMSGMFNLVSYNDEQLEIKGDFQVKEGSGQHFSHPVLNEGVLYIRHGDALMAYRVGEI